MAGIVKVNEVQLGDNADATRNLVLRTNADGSFTFARGNVGATTQDILTVNALGVVTLSASRFTSSAQTITSAGALTIAHGLGVVPFTVTAYLICTTAEGGFSIGDRLIVGINVVSNSANDTQGMAVTVDSTNVNIRFGSNANVFRTVNKGTGAAAALTNANWQLYLQAVA